MNGLFAGCGCHEWMHDLTWLPCGVCRSAGAPLLLPTPVREHHCSVPACPLPTPNGSSTSCLSRRALLIETSGTTRAPKGVVWTHPMLDYQMRTLTNL